MTGLRAFAATAFLFSLAAASPAMAQTPPTENIQIGLSTDAGLFEETAEVCFDRCISDSKISGNLPHAADINDRAKHTELGWRELVGLADHL